MIHCISQYVAETGICLVHQRQYPTFHISIEVSIVKCVQRVAKHGTKDREQRNNSLHVII